MECFFVAWHIMCDPDRLVEIDGECNLALCVGDGYVRRESDKTVPPIDTATKRLYQLLIGKPPAIAAARVSPRRRRLGTHCAEQVYAAVYRLTDPGRSFRASPIAPLATYSRPRTNERTKIHCRQHGRTCTSRVIITRSTDNLTKQTRRANVWPIITYRWTQRSNLQLGLRVGGHLALTDSYLDNPNELSHMALPTTILPGWYLLWYRLQQYHPYYYWPSVDMFPRDFKIKIIQKWLEVSVLAVSEKWRGSGEKK